MSAAALNLTRTSSLLQARCVKLRYRDCRATNKYSDNKIFTYRYAGLGISARCMLYMALLQIGSGCNQQTCKNKMDKSDIRSVRDHTKISWGGGVIVC